MFLGNNKLNRYNISKYEQFYKIYLLLNSTQLENDIKLIIMCIMYYHIFFSININIL